MARTASSVGTALEQLTVKQIFDMSPGEIRETFSKAEKKLFEQVHQNYVNRVTDDLIWAHDLGNKLQKAIESSATESAAGRPTTWGQHLVERVARGMGLRSADQLYQSIQVYNAWPTKEQFEAEIVSRIGPNQNRLSWNHAANLARIEDRNQRAEAIEEVLDQNLNVRETFRLVQGRQPPKRSNNPSGPFKKPKSFMQAVTQITKEARALSSRCTNSWLKEPTIIQQAVELEPFQVTPELLHIVEMAMQELQTVRGTLNLLDSAFEEVTTVLKRRASIIPAAPAESNETPCPRGGQHEDVSEDGETVCRKCHDPAPHVAEAPRAKTKTKAKGTSPPSTKGKKRGRTKDSPK